MRILLAFQEITGRIAEPSNYTAYKIEFLPREEADTVAVGDVRFYERDRGGGVERFRLSRGGFRGA